MIFYKSDDTFVNAPACVLDEWVTFVPQEDFVKVRIYVNLTEEEAGNTIGFAVKENGNIDNEIAEIKSDVSDIDDTIDDISESLSKKQDIPYVNLINPDEIVENKSIYTDGSERDNQNFNASGYILLEAGKTYYGFGFYSATTTNFLAFYDVNTKAVLSTPDATVTRTSSDYSCTITVGESDVYFRCSIGKANTETAYISEYANSYYPYGVVDFSFLSGNLQDEIDELRAEKDSYKDKKVLIIGDSISTDYYQNYPKWVTALINSGFFSAENVTNDSIHATGFVARYTGSDPDARNDFVNRVQEYTDDAFDTVILFGGINDFISSVDFSDDETDVETYFKPAVDFVFDYLTKTFMSARIVVLSPLRTYNIYPNQVGVKQQEYAKYIRDKAREYAIPCLNLTEESGFMPFIHYGDEIATAYKDKWTCIPAGYEHGDGVHPNEEYSRDYLAPMIKNFLLKFV